MTDLCYVHGFVGKYDLVRRHDGSWIIYSRIADDDFKFEAKTRADLVTAFPRFAGAAAIMVEAAAKLGHLESDEMRGPGLAS